MRIRCMPLPAILLLIAAGCTTPTKFSVEPGPAVSWRPAATTEPAPPSTGPDSATLEARVRDTEQGTDELARAEALYELALAKRHEGDYDEAEHLYRRALEICEHVLGPNDPTVATILNSLGALQASQGRYAAAQPLLERALEIRRAALGDQDALTAQTMNNLALLLAAEGDSDAAEPLYQGAVAVLEKCQPPARGDLDQVLDNYAALLYETGRDDEARELEARARVLRSMQ